jgi:Ca2+-binding RTX toxin-like protein
MARKIRLELAITGTGADEVLNGRNDSIDTIDGGGGNDIIDGLQGADILEGGAGTDTYKLTSWASSNVTYGVDTVSGFEKYDFSNIQHYSDADMLVAVSRALDFGDLTITPIAGGEHVHAEVVAGNGTWDVDLDVLGSAPLTEADFIFA